MWYKFSKLKWIWDMTDGIEYTYAYVNAESKEKAIVKVNTCSNIRRRYSDRGLDEIKEISDAVEIPTEDIVNEKIKIIK
jgi:hypothetical protein